jgi:LL-diaminopimelate aminotransferase
MKLNKNYENLVENYLFAEIGSRVEKFIADNPEKAIIKMGIGDVTKPIVQPVVDAMKVACDELAKGDTFRGYGPYRGYDFLVNAIVDYYKKFEVKLKDTEVFVSEGAKSDVSNITDIFSNIMGWKIQVKSYG